VNKIEDVRVSSWAPIVGRWTITDDEVAYLGPVEGQPSPYGICVSNVWIEEGVGKACVRLSSNTSGRIPLGYRSPTDPYLTVGLAGYRHAYTITEFDPSLGWRGVSNAGNEENLSVEKEYMIEVEVRGQRVNLTVDGVRVLDYVLGHPLTAGQMGLFTWGEKEVRFRAITAQTLPGKVFVVMQFSSPYEQLYKEVIQPVAKEFGLYAYHAGEVFGPGVILKDIAQSITEAKIVIAEVTAPNSNVFYELGYAHALGKPTILLAERGKQLPFDIAGYRCLFYENSIGGKREVEDALKKHLKAILHD
jgi:hypothetical protein